MSPGDTSLVNTVRTYRQSISQPSLLALVQSPRCLNNFHLSYLSHQIVKSFSIGTLSTHCIIFDFIKAYIPVVRKNRKNTICNAFITVIKFTLQSGSHVLMQHSLCTIILCHPYIPGMLAQGTLCDLAVYNSPLLPIPLTSLQQTTCFPVPCLIVYAFQSAAHPVQSCHLQPADISNLSFSMISARKWFLIPKSMYVSTV